MRISKKATTPLWLGKKLYEKLNTDIKYKLEPIDSNELSKQFIEFEKDVESNRIISKDNLDQNELKQQAR